MIDELARAVEALAAFGEKRAGGEAGRRAADFVRGQFSAAGLQPVEEPFQFPRHEVRGSSLAFFSGGRRVTPGYDVLEACGAGEARAPLVWAGRGDGANATELRGKIALVERDPLYHRSAQFQNLAAAGALAMISISSAPENLRQVGSVRRAWEAAGAIPAFSVGARDGAELRAALASGATVEAEASVAIELARGRGQNLLATIEGEEPGHAIAIGAHYDTWFAGSTDNGAGVAGLLALAARRARAPRPRHSLTFVAWDGEELALYGGYHFLRVHRPSLLAAIDLETPAARGAQAYGLACSAHAPLEAAVVGVGLHELFALDVPMDLVPELFGGSIPTDIQGVYRAGTAAMSTAADAPYYHTVEDTPDKVDLVRLAATVEGFDRALDRLLVEPAERFARRDPALWQLDVRARKLGGDWLIDVAAGNGAGQPQPGARVEATLFYDDFFVAADAIVSADSSGRAALRLADAPNPGPRFLHVTAGARYPLVEHVARL